MLTPHDLHSEQTIAALEAGKDVFCEKPMALTIAECDAMLATAARSGQQLFVTHALRTTLVFERAWEQMSRGVLGRVTLGTFNWFTDELPRLEDPNHWKGTLDHSGGAALIDGGCHLSDLGNKLFGPARRVQAFAERLVVACENVGEDTAVFQVEYDSGTLASYALTFIAGSGMRPHDFACGIDIQLYGLQGHIEGGFRSRDGDRWQYCREHRTGKPDQFQENRTSDFGEVDTLLLRALQGTIDPPVTAVEARNAVAVVEAAYRSIETGGAVEVDWLEE